VPFHKSEQFTAPFRCKASGQVLMGLPCSTLPFHMEVGSRAINNRNAGYAGLKLEEAKTWRCHLG